MDYCAPWDYTASLSWYTHGVHAITVQLLSNSQVDYASIGIIGQQEEDQTHIQ